MINIEFSGWDFFVEYHLECAAQDSAGMLRGDPPEAIIRSHFVVANHVVVIPFSAQFG